MGFQGKRVKRERIPKLFRRPLSFVGVLFGILMIHFALIQATDTGRMRQENLQTKATSPEAMEERIAIFRSEFDLDRPIPARFVSWVGKMCILDFGHSMTNPRPVKSIVSEALAKSLWLQVPSILLFYLVGIPLGVFLARRADGFIDRALSTFLLGAYAVPTFWLATLLLIYGATASGFDLFPLEGLSSDRMEDAGGFAFFIDRLKHIALPVLAMSIPGITLMTRQTRSAVVEALSSEYVLAARAAGISEDRVVWVHALRDSLLPAATLLGLLIPQIVGGSVIVESIFNIKGMGWLLWQAAQSRDFPVLQTLVLFSTVLTLLGFFVSDFLVAKLLPRRRAAQC